MQRERINAIEAQAEDPLVFGRQLQESEENMKDKRDILGTDTELDRKPSGIGNSSAHGGDVFLDTQLCGGLGRRKDYEVFKSLYGLMPEVVLRISKHFAMLQAY